MFMKRLAVHDTKLKPVRKKKKWKNKGKNLYVKFTMNIMQFLAIFFPYYYKQYNKKNIACCCKCYQQELKN